MRSLYGQLKRRFDNTGIGGCPIITDHELKEFLALTEELVRVCEDIGMRPLATWFSIDRDGIERMIENRKDKR